LDIEFLKIKQENTDKQVEIWAQDEARLGLQPTIRRTWSPKGKRFIAQQIRKYEWIYTYSFVHPLTGKSFWLILPTVNTTLMSLALKEFSEYINPQKEKYILLLMDGAGWHKSKELEIPENIQIFPLPPYSPELQPVECGWPLLKESIANKYFDNLNTLEDTVAKRCEWMFKNPEILKGAVGFNWIQEIEDTSN
jgi:transposase